MGMYSAYFDAAGSFNPKHPDKGSQDALVVSGYVTSKHRWLKFEKKWNTVLVEAGITVPFHMTDFMYNGKNFKDWKDREPEKIPLLMVLARLIRKHVTKAIGEGVLIGDWKRVNKIYALDRNHCTPFALAGFFVLEKTMRWVGNHHDNKIKTAIVFEDGDAGKGDLMWTMEQVRKKVPLLIPKGVLQFADKDLVQFQACDFVAWEKRQEFGNRLCLPLEAYPGPSEPLQELWKLDRDWGYSDYGSLIAFCEQYDVPKIGEDREWDGVVKQTY